MGNERLEMAQPAEDLNLDYCSSGLHHLDHFGADSEL